jgi:hypothetical protein
MNEQHGGGPFDVYPALKYARRLAMISLAEPVSASGLR